MKKLSIAYFGTPYFSARFLEKLLTDTSIKHLIEVKLVATQPDQPVGRQQIITPSPVKVVAKKYGIAIFTVNSNLKTQKSKLQLKIKKFRSLDLAVLFAYGSIIPKTILN